MCFVLFFVSLFLQLLVKIVGFCEFKLHQFRRHDSFLLFDMSSQKFVIQILLAQVKV